tara:strand:- start:955 stop:2130 length:1176 start_codon:yes stop_codon:yes gene_type:complete
MISNNKTLLTYFLYLLLGSIFYLIFHIDEFPNKYTFTDWLINYEGGFVRRGLLGQIIFDLSKFLNFQIKFIILFFQITIYSIYFFLFYSILSKRKINFFWLLVVFSPILFLYPLAELEALGRKDIFVITFFLIFSMINYKNLNVLLFSFILLFSLSCLIHEITIFYIFHYFFVFYVKNKFFINEQINKKHYSIFLIFIAILLYLNLYLHNFVIIEDIVNSYNFEDFTNESGSFSHISPSIDSVFLKTFNSIDLASVTRYGFLILINTTPFIFFIKIKDKYKNKYFNSQNIFFTIILLSVPLYLLIFDWGRVIYMSHNFFIIIMILIFKLNLVDENYLENKLKNLRKSFKIFIFIIVCLSFSPKILITDDLASFPLYRSVAKIFKITNNFDK